jgi:hypothetical protein
VEFKLKCALQFKIKNQTNPATHTSTQASPPSRTAKRPNSARYTCVSRAAQTSSASPTPSPLRPYSPMPPEQLMGGSTRQLSPTSGRRSAPRLHPRPRVRGVAQQADTPTRVRACRLSLARRAEQPRAPLRRCRTLA